VPRKRPAKPKKPISAKTRAADDALRAELRKFDLKKFDKALAKAIKPSARA
jgi:hypothetical protein